MTTVAVTGASGFLGRKLCEALDARPDITRVVGIDVRDPEFATRNLEFYRMDMRSDAVAGVLAGADVVVHLAFVMAAQRDRDEMHDINVDGSRNVFSACVEAGVRKLIHLSSALAYGSHADNDFPLTEQSAIRGLRDFDYSWHKAELEPSAAALRGRVPVVTVLRPPFVLGPGVRNAVSSLIEAPVFVTIEGYSPPIGFVHVDDVARALLHVIDHDLDGPYNLAPEPGWLGLDDVAQVIGRRRVTLSYDDAYHRAERMWKLGLSSVPPGYLPLLMYPWVVDGSKLRATGFEFTRTAEDALRDAVAHRRGMVSMGRVRFRPKIVGALAGAAVLAAALSGRRRGKT